MRECSGCHQSKPASEFQRDRTKGDGLRTRCRPCVNGVNAIYRGTHRSEIAAIGKAWAVKNRRRTRAATKRYRQRHPDRQARIQANWRRKAKVARAQYNQRWWREHPEAHHRRRVRLLQAKGTFTAAEFRALCAAHGNRCLACGEKKPLSADHVVPLIKGGSNYIANIQPLCVPCNSSKGTKTIDYRKAA